MEHQSNHPNDTGDAEYSSTTEWSKLCNHSALEWQLVARHRTPDPSAELRLRCIVKKDTPIVNILHIIPSATRNMHMPKDSSRRSRYQMYLICLGCDRAYSCDLGPIWSQIVIGWYGSNDSVIYVTPTGTRIALGVGIVWRAPQIQRNNY